MQIQNNHDSIEIINLPKGHSKRLLKTDNSQRKFLQIKTFIQAKTNTNIRMFTKQLPFFRAH